MYISDITHFIDDDGNIPKEMPKEAREFTSFLALLIDEITREKTKDKLRCFNKQCKGFISSEYLEDEMEGDMDEIHWKCSDCENEGKITGWQSTKWDNR